MSQGRPPLETIRRDRPPHPVTFRPAVACDIPAMSQFLFEHGTNPWNYLNVDDVRVHLDGITRGETQGVLAETDRQLIGFVTFEVTTKFSRFQSADRQHLPQGLIGEAVVNAKWQGNGYGTALLLEAVAAVSQRGIRDVYVERHEENLASAGMMRKAGFVVIETFFDPPRRTTGSRRTSVLKHSCHGISPASVRPFLDRTTKTNGGPRGNDTAVPETP